LVGRDRGRPGRGVQNCRQCEKERVAYFYVRALDTELPGGGNPNALKIGTRSIVNFRLEVESALFTRDYSNPREYARVRIGARECRDGGRGDRAARLRLARSLRLSDVALAFEVQRRKIGTCLIE